MINKDPIYQQLNQELRRIISGDKVDVGDRFMTERVICDRYGVSRATANKSLSSLVSEGLLRFKKGVGTFVRSKPAAGRGLPFTSFTEKARRAGKSPTSRVLIFERLAARSAEPAAAERLEVDPGEELYRLERLRMADQVPMLLERRYIVARHCPDLTERSLSGSLYGLFTETYGLRISATEETIHAVVIADEEAALLEVEPGKAGFLVVAVGYVEPGVPLWWERTLHRPDGFEFRCQVRPDEEGQRLEGRLNLT